MRNRVGVLTKGGVEGTRDGGGGGFGTKLRHQDRANAAVPQRCFNEYPPGDNDVSAITTLRWGRSELSLNYRIKPPADFDLADVYAEVYQQGGGNLFTVNSNQAATIPAAVVVEGSNWCSVWVAEGGMSYSGIAQSTPTPRLDNDLVAWELSGGGTFAQYEWRAPLGTPGAPVVRDAPKGQSLAQRSNSHYGLVTPRRVRAPGLHPPQNRPLVGRVPSPNVTKI